MAGELWRARAAGRCVDPEVWPDGGLKPDHGRAIAQELYAALGAAGSRRVGWKLGATDPAVQALLRTDRPFAAPVYDTAVISPGGRIEMSRLVAPRIEAELAILIENGTPFVSVCIEVADSRLADWDLTLGDAIADFGLQAHMTFGDLSPIRFSGPVDIVISHNGEPRASACPSLASALAAARRLSEQSPLGPDFEVGGLIATGSATPPLTLLPGFWMVDFGVLGRLGLEVAE
jgi:2-keto-4-pentenoate hydratase